MIIQKSQEVHFITYTSTSLYNCTPHATRILLQSVTHFLIFYDPICRERKITDFVRFPCTVVPLKFKNQIKIKISQILHHASSCQLTFLGCKHHFFNPSVGLNLSFRRQLVHQGCMLRSDVFWRVTRFSLVCYAHLPDFLQF